MDAHLMFSVLRKAGFSETHSEAITTVMREARSSCEFATKNDLQDIRYEMKCLEHRPTNKVGAIVIGSATVMMFVDKYLLFLEK